MARKHDERAELSEYHRVSKLEAEGYSIFWSRFGGWKFGRRDRDDDAAEGYTIDALEAAVRPAGYDSLY